MQLAGAAVVLLHAFCGDRQMAMLDNGGGGGILLHSWRPATGTQGIPPPYDVDRGGMLAASCCAGELLLLLCSVAHAGFPGGCTQVSAHAPTGSPQLGWHCGRGNCTIAAAAAASGFDVWAVAGGGGA